MTRARTLKLMTITTVMMVFFAAVSVAYGGLTWTGIDPAFALSDGTPVNVFIATPDENWCDINNPIPVTITAPVALDTPVTESLLERDCDGKSDTLTTVTTLIPGKHDDRVKVEVYASSKNRRAKFPVEVLIEVDGIELKVCSAAINRAVTCSVKIDDAVEGEEDEKDRKSRP